jgi:hypothetical protein
MLRFVTLTVVAFGVSSAFAQTSQSESQQAFLEKLKQRREQFRREFHEKTPTKDSFLAGQSNDIFDAYLEASGMADQTLAMLLTSRYEDAEAGRTQLLRFLIQPLKVAKDPFRGAENCSMMMAWVLVGERASKNAEWVQRYKAGYDNYIAQSESRATVRGGRDPKTTAYVAGMQGYRAIRMEVLASLTKSDDDKRVILRDNLVQIAKSPSKTTLEVFGKVLDRIAQEGFFDSASIAAAKKDLEKQGG